MRLVRFLRVWATLTVLLAGLVAFAFLILAPSGERVEGYRYFEVLVNGEVKPYPELSYFDFTGMVYEGRITEVTVAYDEVVNHLLWFERTQTTWRALAAYEGYRQDGTPMMITRFWDVPSAIQSGRARETLVFLEMFGVEVNHAGYTRVSSWSFLFLAMPLLAFFATVPIVAGKRSSYFEGSRP